jgi:hypothetical protein
MESTRRYTRSDNTVRELSTMHLPWQQWKEPQYGLMMLAYQVNYLNVLKSYVKKLGGNDQKFLPTTHESCITTMHLLIRHSL